MDQSRFIRAGNSIVNPDRVTHIDVEPGQGATVHFSGGHPLRLSPGDCDLLLEALFGTGVPDAAEPL